MLETLKKYRSHFLLTGLFVFLIHGTRLLSDIIGIDTEDLIHLQKGFYGGWLITGRQGLVFLKYLFGNSEFNPYFSGIMTLLLFSTAVFSFCFFWDKVSGRDAAGWESLLAWGTGGFLWISHPVLAEQFYFSLQSMEICIGFVITVLALQLSNRFAQTHRWIFFAGSIPLLVLSFSVYQVFVVCYIFGVVTLLLLQGVGELLKREDKKVTAGTLLKGMVPYVAVFLVAFLINTLITRLFFSSSDYLQNQIMWREHSVKDCILTIAGHLMRVFTGRDSVFYHPIFGLLALSVLALLILLMKECGREKRAVSAVVLFYYLALLSTPFLMTFLLGGAPAVRSQQILPVLTCFLAYLGTWLFLERKPRVVQGKVCLWWRTVLVCYVLVCVFGGLGQAKITEALYYTDRCRYEQDVALGRSILERLDEVDHWKSGLPVVIVGYHKFEPNNACVMGEVIGRSFFDYDMEVEPVCYWSTRRILGFFHTLGANYTQPSAEWMDLALEYSIYMPEWPYENSVQMKDEMIIVKLSHYE